MDFVCRNAMKISLLAQVALILDKKPDLSFEHMIDLFRDVLVRFCVVAGRPRGHHEAALIAVGLLHDHRALSLISTQYDFFYRNVFCFYAERHKTTVLSKLFCPHPSPLPLWRDRLLSFLSLSIRGF